MYYPEKSLKNAKKLLVSPDLENVVSLRLEPEPKTCCCSDCWPLVWQEVNDSIHPQGPVQHEGQALIKVGSERCLLVQNESGPEILLLVTASLSVVAAVVNLIVAICGSLRKERKCPAKVKIVRRRSFGKKIAEDLLVEIDLDDSTAKPDKMKGIIEVAIKNSF